MNMPQKQTISELTLEQYHLGELPARQEQRVREELERDQELRARLEAIQQSDRELSFAYPAERVVPLIKERLYRESGVRPKRRVHPLAWAVPIAAVALVLATFSVTRSLPSETRLKGLTPHLSVFRKTASGAEELRPDAIARRGDVLQLSYVAGGAKYGVIFSVDGRGAVTWHVPPGYSGGSRTASPLDERGAIVLPSAYELDDAPGFERFFLVYGSAGFEVADVERAVRALAARPTTADRDVLVLPRGLGQYSLLVKKQG